MDAGTKETTNRPAWLAYVVLLFLFFAVLEVASFAFWSIYGEHRTKFHQRVDMRADIDALDEADFDRFLKDKYDPELGWNERANIVDERSNVDTAMTPEGARINPAPYARKMISTYGDSMTFGAEVGPSETYQYHLSMMTESDVVNYGVSGYGPDQALLRMKRNLSNGLGTPIIALAMPSENIARVVNIFPRLYWAQGSAALTKPIYVPSGDGLTLFSMPASFDANSPQQRLALASRHDFWFRQNERRLSGFLGA